MCWRIMDSLSYTYLTKLYTYTYMYTYKGMDHSYGSIVKISLESSLQQKFVDSRG